MRRERSITNGRYFWIIHAGSRITADVSNRARRVAANRLRAGSRIAGLLANFLPRVTGSRFIGVYGVIFDVPACPV
jgi:hypothetical protein